MAVRFERYAPAKNDGFEEGNLLPAWCMVPEGKRKGNLVICGAKGATLRSTDDSVLKMFDPKGQVVSELQVKYDRHVLPLMGVGEGTADLWCSAGGTGFAGGMHNTALQVRCLKKKVVKVAFHYLEDSTGRKARRPMGSENDLLRMVNRVFQRQANITFKKVKAHKLKVNKDLGDPISYATLGGSHLPELHNLADPTAKINVFFSWEYTPTAGGSDADAEVDQIGCHEVIFEDKAGSGQGLSLAHEFGHNLGLPHLSKSLASNKKYLMWPFTGQRSGCLSSAEIITVHSAA